MFFSFDGVSVFYKRHLGMGVPIVLLHGWGGNNVSFSGTFDYLGSLNRDVISVDFPGFGSSEMPGEDWGIEDYARCIDALVQSLRIRKAILVGHSFGGRVAVCLGNSEWVESLILVDSAGLKPRFSLTKKLNVWRYKRAKKAGKDVSKFGSTDYLALTPPLKNVFVRVVNTYLDDRLKEITCPVLIIWGRKDRETPLYMARKFKHRLKNSTLIVMHGGHFAYVENQLKFNLIVAEFTKVGAAC